MIEVEYYYITKSGETKKGVTIFYDRTKALRFMYSMKRKSGQYLIGYSCEYPDDTEYLARRISILDINSK